MSHPTAIVTGASRGFGRATSAALVAAGTHVLGLARDRHALDAVRAELGDAFTPVVGDATDDTLAARLIHEHRPNLLVLNAGATPHVAPIHEQTWDTFSRNWHVDTKHAFTWLTAALREPLAPGSVVLAVSSGAALFGSPLSGGYASANAGVRHLRDYAADEADRAGLGIRFVTLFPQMTQTGVGAVGVTGYSAREGISPEEYVERRAPMLTVDVFAKAVLDVAADQNSATEYLVGAAGARVLA